MKSKLFLSAAASLMFTASASASNNSGVNDEPALDYSAFSSGITYTFDDTLKRSVFKGPIITQDVKSAIKLETPNFRNIQDSPSLRYSLFVDEGVIKMNYIHTYRSGENKNFHKVIDYKGRSYAIQTIQNSVEDCRGQTSYANSNTCLIKESGIIQLDPHMKYKYQLVATNGQNLDFEINVDYMDAISDFHKKITSVDKNIKKSNHFKHKKLSDLRYGGEYNPTENKRRGERIYHPDDERIEKEEVRKRQIERRTAYRDKMEARKINSEQSDNITKAKKAGDCKRKIKGENADLKAQKNEVVESITVEETKKVTVTSQVKEANSAKPNVKVINARDLKKTTE